MSKFFSVFKPVIVKMMVISNRRVYGGKYLAEITLKKVKESYNFHFYI